MKLIETVPAQYRNVQGCLDPTGMHDGWAGINVWVAVDDAGRSFVWGNQEQPIGPEHKALMDRWQLRQILGSPKDLPAKEIAKMVSRCIFRDKSRYITWGQLANAPLSMAGFLVG